jgi:hypothetical protein
MGAATATFAAELKGEGFTIAAICPGWCNTDLGTGGGTTKVKPPVEPCDSIAGMIKVLDGLTLEKTGAFLNWEGNTVPW